MSRQRSRYYYLKLWLLSGVAIIAIILAWEYVSARTMWYVAGFVLIVSATLQVLVSAQRKKKGHSSQDATPLTCEDTTTKATRIPYAEEIRLPLLECLRDGKEQSRQELLEAMATRFHLTDEQRNERGGRQTVIDYRLGIARTWLMRADFVEYAVHGGTRITEAGLRALARQPQRLDDDFLGQIATSSTASEATKGTDPHRATEAYSIHDEPASQFRVISEDESGMDYHPEELRHVTVLGEKVRSKGELVIANRLASLGIRYGYEVALTIGGSCIYPDFTIETKSGKKYFWEHVGMLDDPAYHERWIKKRNWYTRHGIFTSDEGGGEDGTLIITYDSPLDGISSAKIDYQIDTVLLR